MAFVGVLLCAALAAAAGANWQKVGPANIGDDVHLMGEAGTLADAASPAGNPSIIYAGGQNNGASSGVLKSVDGGKHWALASNGMFNTRVSSLHVVDDKGDHVLAGTAGGVYESRDAAASWTLVYENFCNTIKNGTILNEPSILMGCRNGIVNKPISGGNWSVIPSPGQMTRTYLTVSSPSHLQTSVVGGCLGGRLALGTVLNRTAAAWQQFAEHPCVMLALDPNNEKHFIYTHPPVTYQSWDGGKTLQNLNKSNIFHCGIDQQGWLYTAAMGGAFRSNDSGKTWQAYYDTRISRRTNATRTRVPHDYQRVAIPFAGKGVAFTSDQGLFIKPPGDGLQLIAANGDMSNNIALQVAVSEGDGPGKNYLVTTVWDWAPLASWDSGAHWGSWETKDDGGSAGCIGEGGGAYGMGRSNQMLVIHKHNILHSARGGKNLTRFVMPHNAVVGPPAYLRRPGSRTEPSGVVFAPGFLGPLPWTARNGRAVACETSLDLGPHTNQTCLGAADLATSYGWLKGANYAVWRGDSNKHCYVCSLPQDNTTWNFTSLPGAVSFVPLAFDWHTFIKQYDTDGSGRIEPQELDPDAEDPVNEDDDDDDDHGSAATDADGHLGPEQQAFFANDATGWRAGRRKASPPFILRNTNFGHGNWSYWQLPDYLMGLGGFAADPTSNALYGCAPGCLARSMDQGETWEGCMKAPGLTGRTGCVAIKDSSTMVLTRDKDVPLRTKDGGKTWHPLTSAAAVANYNQHASYSWTGRTLVLQGSGGQQSPSHPHAAYVWISTDDGDTWRDETGDIVTMGTGGGQWYEGKLYLNSMGQGILAKDLEAAETTILV